MQNGIFNGKSFFITQGVPVECQMIQLRHFRYYTASNLVAVIVLNVHTFQSYTARRRIRGVGFNILEANVQISKVDMDFTCNLLQQTILQTPLQNIHVALVIRVF
mmetsp:Transcript_113059/g.326684  ORF Transcript_113059/g.326684 Transcript_113059/m.326684 type:complete len:105 (+) Transcript_113059:446-760(+)